MTYSDDACMTSFTPCQSNRMNHCLDSIRRTAWFVSGEDCPIFRLAEQSEINIQEPFVDVFPNPVHSNATIRIALPEDELVSVSLYDARGKVVEVMVTEKQMPQGGNDILLPKNLASGTYLIHVRLTDRSICKKVLVK